MISMKENILEENDNENLLIQNLEVKVEKQEKKPKCNYKIWIAIFLILDVISFIFFTIFVLAKNNVFWLFLAFILLFTIVLAIFIVLKIKSDKKERELEILRLEEERIRKEEEEKRRKEEEERIKKEEEEKRRKEEEERIKKEEEAKLNEMKIKMLENQQKLREKKEDPENMTEQEKNKQINDVLEDMCIYGEVTKKEIKEEKEKHPEKFVETSTALTMENQDSGLFALGLLSSNLEELGIETAIEKDENPNDQNKDLTSMQFLSNGMVNKKKYDLHFELGEKRNDEVLNNKEEYEKFKENLKLKLSKDYNIPPEKIIVTLPQRGSLRVQVIFQNDDFHNLDKNQFINKFKNDPEFKELSNLKDIHEDVIMGGVKLSRNQLDPRGNRNDGWAVGKKRGGKDYDPPIGWNGIGLKVWDKYDNGDNTWLGMNNNPGEWCVAYHGVGNNQSSDKVKNVTGVIYTSEKFKAGSGQVHKDCPDIYHPGKKVGVGVYCTPHIQTAEGYAGVSNINGTNYKTVLMVRVKSSAIRHCTDSYDYWVVDGTTNEIRPYRILYRKC